MKAADPYAKNERRERSLSIDFLKLTYSTATVELKLDETASLSPFMERCVLGTGRVPPLLRQKSAASFHVIPILFSFPFVSRRLYRIHFIGRVAGLKEENERKLLYL